MLTTSRALLLVCAAAMCSSRDVALQQASDSSGKTKSEIEASAHLQYLFDLLPRVSVQAETWRNGDRIRAIRAELSTINTRLWLQFNATGSQLLNAGGSQTRLTKAELHLFLKPRSQLSYHASKDGPESAVSGVLHRLVITDRSRRRRRQSRRSRRRRKRHGRRNRRGQSRTRRRLRLLGRFAIAEAGKQGRHRKRQIDYSSDAWHRVDITQTLLRHLNSVRALPTQASLSRQRLLLLVLSFEKRKSNGKVRGVSLQRFLAVGGSRAPFLTLRISSDTTAPEALMQQRPTSQARSRRQRRDLQHLLPDSADGNNALFNMTWEAEQPCHAVPHRLHFADLGWDGWILRPESVPFGACVGTCGLETRGASNHAVISAALHQSQPRQQVMGNQITHLVFYPPAPCCVPVVSMATPLVFRDSETGDGVLKVLKDLAMTDCSCR